MLRRAARRSAWPVSRIDGSSVARIVRFPPVPRLADLSRLPLSGIPMLQGHAKAESEEDLSSWNYLSGSARSRGWACFACRHGSALEAGAVAAPSPDDCSLAIFSSTNEDTGAD